MVVATVLFEASKMLDLTGALRKSDLYGIAHHEKRASLAENNAVIGHLLS